ncbi:hypothetical protein BGW80DRAFT_1159948, partial [Lactifluus volemus]
MSHVTKSKLQSYWKSKAYLIIDEFSMISKSFLSKIERNVSIGKQGSQIFPDWTFGGLNVVLCGDLHQFPPVAKGSGEFLFTPNKPGVDSQECQSGGEIYKEFKTVVILKEQKRVTDPVWHRMLTHLRAGEMTIEDVQMLRELVIGHSSESDVDFGVEPWSNAALVTPRHAVRIMWNQLAARQWCMKSQQQLFLCPAQDTIGDNTLTPRERVDVATYTSQKKNQRRTLPDEVELAKGLKIMVTNNLATDLDITNGARGEIVDIILDEEEPPLPQSSVVRLHKMPRYVLVKLSRTRA